MNPIRTISKFFPNHYKSFQTIPNNLLNLIRYNVVENQFHPLILNFIQPETSVRLNLNPELRLIQIYWDWSLGLCRTDFQLIFIGQDSKNVWVLFGIIRSNWIQSERFRNFSPNHYKSFKTIPNNLLNLIRYNVVENQFHPLILNFIQPETSVRMNLNPELRLIQIYSDWSLGLCRTDFQLNFIRQDSKNFSLVANRLKINSTQSAPRF